MAYSEEIAGRLREALTHLPGVVEKKMFGGLAFMVNGKMCINAGKDSIMCRIDPAIHEEVIKKKGVQTVKMKGRDYKGFVYVDQEHITTRKELDYWVGLALDFNKIAESSKGRNNKGI